MRKRTAAGMMGLVATVLLHSLFFAAVLLSGSPAKVARLPDAIGAGANTGRPDGESSERMILIQLLPQVAEPQSAPASAPQLAAAPQQPSMLQVMGPDTMPLPPLEFEQEGETREASDADIIARTRLAGLYESQIRARIERAWQQAPPELHANSVYFCRVKVRQRRDGQVEDVIMDNCEGSFEWLDSLVNAIYRASPLPGAPHPGVFAHTFSMQFRSAAARSR